MTAKEYYKKICYESNLWDEKNAKKLANKTLEDVKEEAMLKSKYLEFRGVVIYMEDLDKILEKIKI